MLRRLAVPALLLALAACDGSSDPIDPLSPDPIDLRTLSQDPAALVVTWDLVASLNAETGVLTRPTDADRENLTLRADGTATLAYGDDRCETTYRVRRRTYGNGTRDALPSLLFGEGAGFGEYFGTAGDVLVLDSTPVDGPQSRYRRR